LDELGYDVEWQILNSKYFGVPQNRERVFIIGHLRGKSTKQIFPIGKTTKEFIKSQREAQEERTRFRIANTLSKRYWKDGSENLIQVGKYPYRQVNRVYSPKGISPTLNANTGGRHIPMIISLAGDRDKPSITIKKETGALSANPMSDRQPFVMILRDNKGGNIKKRVRDLSNNPSWCLGGSETLVSNKTNIRKLTPIECERLQGFPDNWTEFGLDDNKMIKISDTQRYKTLGNAITVNVVEYLGRLLL